MRTFLLKTEPDTYSFDDLIRDKRTTWSGVANPQALAFLRTMKKGDEAFIYHTGSEKQIVGLARITTAPYQDPAAPGITADEFLALKNPKGDLTLALEGDRVSVTSLDRVYWPDEKITKSPMVSGRR